MALADSAAENDLENLTRVYENMKPKDAVLFGDGGILQLASWGVCKLQVRRRPLGLSPEKPMPSALSRKKPRSTNRLAFNQIFSGRPDTALL